MKNKSVSNWFWIGFVVLAIGGVIAAQQLRPPPAEAAAVTDAASPAPDTVVVYKSPSCGCCVKWIDHLRQAGFTVEARNEAQMSLVKSKLGVSEAVASCHTATVNGYVIEGHVPADDIRQLLAKRPKAIGIAVPGMPIGSPGMEVDDRVEPYQTLLFDAEGKTTVFNQHGTRTAAPDASAAEVPTPAS